MSYQIEILSDDEFLTSDLWIRPLQFTGGDFGGMDYTEGSTHGCLINNFKWANIQEVLGPCWLDGTKTISETGYGERYEFARGELPRNHFYSSDEIARMNGYSLKQFMENNAESEVAE